MTIFVDSDILIEVFRARDENILSKWFELAEPAGRILYSPVNAAELWAGAKTSEHRSIEHLFRTMICVPIEQETGRKAGEYLRQFSASHGVKLGDALIAAAASLNGAVLWTRNRKQYPMKDLSFF